MCLSFAQTEWIRDIFPVICMTFGRFCPAHHAVRADAVTLGERDSTLSDRVRAIDEIVNQLARRIIRP